MNFIKTDMDDELLLRVQSYLDGELSQSEATQVRALIDQNATLGEVYASLKETKAALRSNEPEITLPESGDFYWSKIQKAIANGEANAPTPSRFATPWWVRLLIPVMGLAAVLLLTLTPSDFFHAQSPRAQLHEIDTPVDDISAISFHSDKEGMTVVWVASNGIW